MDFIKIYVAYISENKSLAFDVIPYVDQFKKTWEDKYKNILPLFVHVGITRPNNVSILNLLNDHSSNKIVTPSAKYILSELIDISFDSEGYENNLHFFLDSQNSEFKNIYKKSISPESIDKELLTYSIDKLPLSVRAKRGLDSKNIKTISDLIACTEIDIRKIPNIGSGSYFEIAGVLNNIGLSLNLSSENTNKRLIHHILNSDVETDHEKNKDTVTKAKKLSNTFFDIDETDLSTYINSARNFLNENEFEVFSSRLGLNDKPLTLESVGEKSGVTRERIRQIQKKASIKILAHLPIIEFIDTKLSKIRENLLIPLFVKDIPDHDPWFEILRYKPWLLKSILNNEEDSVHNVQIFDDDEIVTIGGNNSLFDTIKTLKLDLKSKINSNFSKEDLKFRIRELLPLTYQELTNYIILKLQNEFQFTDASSDSESYLVSSGRGNLPLLIKILESSNTPLSTDEICLRAKADDGDRRTLINALGKDERIFIFGTSLYGTKKHLNLTESEIDFITSSINSYILEKNPKRLWRTTEIISDMHFPTSMEEHLNKYTLAACVSMSDNFEYFGNFLFSLKGHIKFGEEKVDNTKLVEEILEKSETPLTFQEIKKELLSERGISDTFQMHNKGRIIPIREYVNKSTSPGAETKWALLDKHLHISDKEVKKIISEMNTLMNNNSLVLNCEEAISLISMHIFLSKFKDSILTLFYICERSIFFIIKGDLLVNIKSDFKLTTQLDVLKKIGYSIPKSGISSAELYEKVTTLYGGSVPRNLISYLGNYEFIYNPEQKKWFWDDTFVI